MTAVNLAGPPARLFARHAMDGPGLGKTGVPQRVAEKTDFID